VSRVPYPVSRLSRRANIHWWLFRQKDGERRPFLLVGNHLDVSSVLLDDAEGDGQTQSGSFALFLGGKERFENVGKDLG